MLSSWWNRQSDNSVREQMNKHQQRKYGLQEDGIHLTRLHREEEGRGGDGKIIQVAAELKLSDNEK